MQDNNLTPILTPDGLPTYAEAKLVLEAKLIQVTTVSPEDFMTKEGKDFVVDGYNDAGEYHKVVFGEITKVWRKK